MLQTNLFKTSKFKILFELHGTRFCYNIKLSVHCSVLHCNLHITNRWPATYTADIHAPSTTVLRIQLHVVYNFYTFNNFNSSSATSYSINSDKQSSVVWPQLQVGYNFKVKDLVQQQSRNDPWIQKLKNNNYDCTAPSSSKNKRLHLICSTGKLRPGCTRTRLSL